ncbi:non-ribosomal peptide synthetase [Acanthopleuribacter pedis]|uniref:Amino acid adenylation domain-containing protein n=1 Tax=Acanthopleuribacter pedis TaxID=442870 RepID=A0A8J7Q9G5_9BACT|nr:non-ribosomal peptide synthetase [Acanthopleuribacter pedis]MBO1319414.1 amino acid adenylation domain-containing protein [Acanthopleuribacter pedis]
MSDIHQRIAGLSPEKRALLLQKLGLEQKAATPSGIPYAENRDQDFPLSFAQQRLWFLQQLEGAGEAYHIPLAFQLDGFFQPELFERAIEALIDQHESLRTVFSERDGVPVQRIGPTRTNIQHLDLSDVAPSQVKARVEAMAEEEAARPFDLSSDPLLRAQVLRLSPRSHVVLLTMHHIVSDGWSLGVLMGDFVALYRAFAEDRPSPLKPLQIQYADFAVWQRNTLRGENLDRQLRFWKENLADLPTLLELPTDFPRPKAMSYRGNVEPLVLSKDLSDRLARLSRAQNTTLYTTLLTAFQLLLGKYARSTDITVGSPIANRTRREVEGLIGLFVNTLVLRNQYENTHSFCEVLARVHQHVLAAHDHQDVPFEQLVDVLQPVRSTAHTPLFQAMFVLQNAPGESEGLPGLTLSTPEREHKVSKFDLHLSMSETDAGLRGSLEYSTDLWRPETIQRFLGHFERLLEAITADPNQAVGRYSLLDDATRALVLNHPETTLFAYDVNHTAHRRFEVQAARAPERPAVIFAGETMSYGELNQRAETMARQLYARGVRLDDTVAVYLERGHALIVALLAVHKLGAGYAPIDPFYPQQRIAYVLEDAQPAMVITEFSLVADLPGDMPTFIVEENHGAAPAYPAIPDGCEDRLAYTIYTSGSTGKPKGVQIPQKALTNFLVSVERRVPIDRDDTLLCVSSLAFDIAEFDVWLPLSLGAAVVLAHKQDILDGTRLVQLIQKHRVTSMQATPSGWRLLLDGLGERRLPGLKIQTGGEALPGELAARMEAAGFQIFSLYGPTETTIYSSFFPVTEPFQGNASLGDAFDNTQLVVLDENLEPVPPGVPGEMYIGGDGLARGYHGRPALTAEKFRPNPFATVPGDRLYQSGDLAKRESNGHFTFLGRADFQVKIRGFRIELGEIEARLASHAGVRQAVVLAHDGGPRGRFLVAYVVGEGKAPSSDTLKSYIAEALPEYMVPEQIIALEAMPLTPNNKLNRKALPAPNQQEAVTQRFVAPATEAEKKLAVIWQNVLGLEKVSSQANFFDIGGHSLLLARVHAALRKQFPKNITLLDLFRYTTISSLAAYLSDSGTAESARGLSQDRAQRQREAAMKQRRKLVRRPRPQRSSN